MKGSGEKANSVLANQRSWFQYIQLSFKHNLVVAASCAPYCAYISGGWIAPTLPMAAYLSMASALVGTVVYGIIWHKDLFHLGHQLCGYKLPDSEEEHDDSKEGEYHGYWRYWIAGVVFHSFTAFLGASAIALTMQNILPWGELAGAIPTSIQDPLYSIAGKVMASDFAHGIVSNSWFADHVVQISWRHVLPFGFNALYSLFIAPWALNHIITTGRFNSSELKEEFETELKNQLNVQKQVVKDKLGKVVFYSEKITNFFAAKKCEWNIDGLLLIMKTKLENMGIGNEPKTFNVQPKTLNVQSLNTLHNIEHAIGIIQLLRQGNYQILDSNKIVEEFHDKFSENASVDIVDNESCKIFGLVDILKFLIKRINNLHEKVGSLKEDIKFEDSVIKKLSKHKEVQVVDNPTYVDDKFGNFMDRILAELSDDIHLGCFRDCVENLELNEKEVKMLGKLLVDSIQSCEKQIKLYDELKKKCEAQHKAEREQYKKIQLQETRWSAVKMVISPCLIGMFNAMIQVGCSICY